MKKLTSTFATFLSLVSSLGCVGCSVQQANVTSHPPTFVDPADAFKQLGIKESGTFTPTGVTLFYWPDGYNEEQIRQTVRTVKSASAGLDKLSYKFNELTKRPAKSGDNETEGEKSKAAASNGRLATLDDEFKEKKCIEDFAENTTISNDPDSDLDWVSSWKEIEPAPAVPKANEGEPGYEAYAKYQNYLRFEACKANQEERKTIIAWCFDGGMIQEKNELLDRLFAAIDPETYKPGPSSQKLQVNYKKVATAGSSIKIANTDGAVAQVEIVLKDFMYDGQTRTNVAKAGMSAAERSKLIQNAMYDVKRKLLVFSVPELNERGALTGKELFFALERTPDFLGRARFSGDVKVRHNGVVLRRGSAQFEGVLNP